MLDEVRLKGLKRIVWGLVAVVILGMCLCPPYITKDKYYFFDDEDLGDNSSYPWRENLSYRWPSYHWVWIGPLFGQAIYWQLLLVRCFAIMLLGQTVITGIKEIQPGFGYAPWLIWIFIWMMLCLFLFCFP